MTHISDVGVFHTRKNHVFVTDLESGPTKTKAGIIIPDDNMKNSGVRERWGKVWKVGPEVDDLKPGEWILVKHGRWTEGINLDMPEGTIKVWRVEYPDSVLLASDDCPLSRLPTTF